MMDTRNRMQDWKLTSSAGRQLTGTEKQAADTHHVTAFFHGDPVIGAHAHG